MELVCEADVLVVVAVIFGGEEAFEAAEVGIFVAVSLLVEVAGLLGLLLAADAEVLGRHDALLLLVSPLAAWV